MIDFEICRWNCRSPAIIVMSSKLVSPNLTALILFCDVYVEELGSHPLANRLLHMYALMQGRGYVTRALHTHKSHHRLPFGPKGLDEPVAKDLL